MLTVTPAASARLARMLADLSAPANAAIRMVLEEQGLRIRLDRPTPNDLKFDHDGRTVLVLDERMSKILARKKVDVEHRDGRARLAMM